MDVDGWWSAISLVDVRVLLVAIFAEKIANTEVQYDRAVNHNQMSVGCVHLSSTLDPDVRPWLSALVLLVTGGHVVQTFEVQFVS